MKPMVTPDARKKIADARDEAVNSLAQTTFVAVALLVNDSQICETAEQTYSGNQKVSPQHVMSDLEYIGKMAGKPSCVSDKFTATSLRHVMNKMVITHAVALLEDFLDRAAEAFSCELEKRSFRAKCKELKDKGVADLETLARYPEAHLLAEVRHVIVHRDGKIDKQFLDGINSSSSNLACRFLSQSVGDQVSIPIDEFIIPALAKAVEFVDNAAKTFLTAI